MLCRSNNHGIFLWKWNNEPCYLALKTDDIINACPTRAPFLNLKGDLGKLFDLTCSEGSMDQTSHIKSKFLHEYFLDTPPASIPKHPTHFLLKYLLNNFSMTPPPPLMGHNLQQKEKDFRFCFNHLISALMHIVGISHANLAYACVQFSGYMATPNAPIFDALHQTFSYLYRYPHLPIMYPSKQLCQGGDALQTFWDNGKAEYLSLTTLTVFTPIILLLFTSFCLMALSSHGPARSTHKLSCTWK
jgi:hypothetical protein